MNKINRVLALILLCSGAYTAYAQSGGVSPYSFYGHGLAQPNAFAFHQLLGGTQAAAQSNLYVNPAQPASYAHIRYTTLDLGGTYQGIHQETQSAGLWNTTGGFRNMGVAFPLKKWMGFSAGIMPYSLAGYDMLTNGTDVDFGDYTRQYKGKGGYNKAHFGIGLTALKYLSLGFNANYIFGSLDQNTNLIFLNNQYNSVRLSERTLASDWMWDAGAQLRIPTGSIQTVIGFTMRDGASIQSSFSDVSYTYIQNGSGSETPLDTGMAALNQPGYIYVPSQMSVGVEISKPVKDLPISAWTVGFQYQVTDQMELLPFSTGTLPWLSSEPWTPTYAESGQRYSMSASMIPSLALPGRRLKSYGAEVAYRASFQFENTGLVLNSTPIRAWQCGLGVGLPLGGRAIMPGDVKFATLHIGAQVGNYGTKQNNLINEFYTQAVVGVTLNDQWFVKFKYR
ncbi:hypothetical protein N9N85_00995 [Schleiferiaceae bacterium]|jgi:hypothetical protein|nr:hypothetical protein [Schleiferiaceae bacterium]